MENMISDLIIGFLKGSLNEKEINQFYDWVNETPENKKIFFEAKMVYDACLFKGSDIDMDKSWQRLLEKKQKQTPKKICGSRCYRHRPYFYYLLYVKYYFSCSDSRICEW